MMTPPLDFNAIAPRSTVRVAWITVLTALLLAAAAQAQTPLSPKALGMGGSYVAVARGQEALQFNPANLALADGPTWSFALVGLTIGGTAAGPGFEDYGRFVAGESDDQAFFDAIPASGAAIDMDVHLSGLALQIGRFALGASYHGVVSQEAPRDMFDLLINGYDASRTDYWIDGTAMMEADYLDVAAGYGWTIKDVSVGLTAHYLRSRQLAGRAFTSAPHYRTTSETDPYDGTVYRQSEMEVDFRDLYAEGGSGFALDVGAAWKPDARWTVSGSVTNLISNLAWGDIQQRTGSLSSEDGLGDALDVSLFLDAASNEDEGTPVETGSEAHPAVEQLLDDARLPRTLRLGGAFQPIKYTQLGASYQQKLSNGLLAGGWDHALGLGLEQRVPFLPIAVRGGFVTAFGEGSMFTLGASFIGIHAGLARMNYDQDDLAHDHWVATFSISFSGRRRTP